MGRLQKFYDTRAISVQEKDFLAQVCHTINGKPIAAETVALMAEELRAALELEPDDQVLDLGCGNGLFSKLLAENVTSVTGVDFSAELIRIASTHNSLGNVRFFHGDITGLGHIEAIRDRRYSKIVMNTGLQHFRPRTFSDILEQILPVASDAPVLVFSYVPENGKQSRFFNTVSKRLKRLYLRLTRRDIFGFWWDRQSLARTASRFGFDCAFPPIDGRIPYAAYRFTAKLSKKPCHPQNAGPEI